MKKYLTIPLLTLGLLLSPVASLLADVTVGVVNMKDAFDNYYKTKDALAKNEEMRANMKRELDEKAEAVKTIEQEAAKLNDDLKKSELSEEKKKAKFAEFQKKYGELQNEVKKLRELEQDKARQIQESNQRVVKGLVDEIKKVVADIVKSKGYDLVLDSSGMSANGVPVVLHHRETFDFTKEVIEKLNADKPAAAPAAAPAKKK